MQIIYWRQGLARQNYGDALNEYLFNRLGGLPNPAIAADNDIVFLLGSVIDDVWLKTGEARRTSPEQSIVYWSCGWRGRPISKDFLQRSKVLAVRGPVTLKRLDLPADTPLGDPALILPLMYRPKSQPSGEVICSPHFGDKRGDKEILAETGADAVLRTSIGDCGDAVEAFIDRICSAKFVVCGAMHAAITAAAYGVPFCFYDGGGIDGPPKWKDFANSVGVESTFLRDAGAGADWYNSVSSQIEIPPLHKLLQVSPIAVPDAVLQNAKEYDDLGFAEYNRRNVDLPLLVSTN